MYTLNDNRVLNEWFYLTLLYTHPLFLEVIPL